MKKKKKRTMNNIILSLTTGILLFISLAGTGLIAQLLEKFIFNIGGEL